MVVKGRAGEMMGGGEKKKKTKIQRLYQVSMDTVLDLECNLSKGFFPTNCLSCSVGERVCVCVRKRPWALLRAFCWRPH